MKMFLRCFSSRNVWPIGPLVDFPCQFGPTWHIFSSGFGAMVGVSYTMLEWFGQSNL